MAKRSTLTESIIATGVVFTAWVVIDKIFDARRDRTKTVTGAPKSQIPSKLQLPAGYEMPSNLLVNPKPKPSPAGGVSIFYQKGTSSKLLTNLFGQLDADARQHPELSFQLIRSKETGTSVASITGFHKGTYQGVVDHVVPMPLKVGSQEASYFESVSDLYDFLLNYALTGSTLVTVD